MAKNLPANARDSRHVGLIPGSGRIPELEWQPTAVFLPGKCHGKRSLVATFHRVAELDSTEHTHTHTHTLVIIKKDEDLFIGLSMILVLTFKICTIYIDV